MVDIDLSQLAIRESEQIEWKQNVADIDDVVATLCAFANDLANLGGGYVVCGAQEEKDEHRFPRLVRAGLTTARLREIEGTVLARCRDRVSPPLTPLVIELPAATDDRRILVLIQPATLAAHTARRGKEGAKLYVRVGRSTPPVFRTSAEDVVRVLPVHPRFVPRINGASAFPPAATSV